MRGLRLNLRTTYTLTTSETMRRVRDRSHWYLTYGLAIMPFCATLEVSQRTMTCYWTYGVHLDRFHSIGELPRVSLAEQLLRFR